MAYAAVNEHRMPYDIDGTEVGYRYTAGDIQPATLIGNGVNTWFTSTLKGNLNKEYRAQTWAIDKFQTHARWFFFPETREITKIGFLWSTTTSASFTNQIIQGSADTTNGVDGTWETGVYTIPTPNSNFDHWRDEIFAIAFSGPVKALRIGILSSAQNIGLSGIHIYGRQAVGARPDDIGFTDSTGADLTALMDYGDQPEGTTEVQSFKVKNLSSTLIANNVNIQLNHPDFTISFGSSGPWQSVLDIASIGPGSVSNLIYVRNLLGPPLLTLGPKAARAIVTVGSWT